jgi:hypothetical protein
MPYQPPDTAYSRTPALLEPLHLFSPEPYSSLWTSELHPGDSLDTTIMGLYLSLSAIHPTVKTVGFLAEFL